MQHLESATRSSACAPLAPWLRGSAAVLLTLAAPVVSTWGRAHHRPHRPDSLVHRPDRRIAHRSGRRHARCRPPRTASPARTIARPLPTQSRPDPQRPSLGRRTPPREGSSYRPHIIRQSRRGPGKPTGPGGGIRTAPQPHPLTSGTQSRLPQRTQPPDRGLAPIRRTPAGFLPRHLPRPSDVTG
jgi:hypothetical protein